MKAIEELQVYLRVTAPFSGVIGVDDVADIVFRLAHDSSLNGRVVVWWSEDEPRLIEWGNRGYQCFTPFPSATYAQADIRRK